MSDQQGPQTSRHFLEKRINTMTRILRVSESPHDVTMLFVYGTLRAGEPAHRLLEGSRLIGEFQTEPGYDLINLGPFPALIEGGSSPVVGEVYAVDPLKLPLLDDYEECPRLFCRAKVRLQEGPSAEAYFFRREKLAPRFKPIASGNWVEREKR